MAFDSQTEKSLEALLRERFSISTFRRGQKAIIESVLGGNDTVAVLPTGGGKSLCYQLPSLFSQKIAVVISPLIALMEDQVSSLMRLGIPAGCLHSGQTEEERRRVFQKLSEGGAFVLYLSPERAQKEGFSRWVKDKPIALFAIDEAHCVSQWGHDFREEYAQLSLLKSVRPDVPVLALTASATPLVLDDLTRSLKLKNPSRHVHGFYRPNLYYQVEECLDEEEKKRFLLQAIQQTPTGRVIIYCGTRRAAEDVAKQLKRSFDQVGFYHAGLTNEERANAQQEYAAGDIRILAATNAFGMGIDHPDVRLVVHYQMPANIDSLYQEMGRAGRDGQHSTCLLLYAKKDKGLQSYFIQSSGAPATIKQSRWNTLDALVGYCEGSECRHGEILTYYQDSQRLDACGHCDSCSPDSDRRIEKPLDVMLPSRKVSRKKKAQKILAEEGFDDLQRIRFDALKDWRKRKAKELDVAAFMVFSDKTLRHLATEDPRSRESLGAINGIGPAKLEAFGTELLVELSALR